MKLNEWKQNELNRLLMEKFNLKEKKKGFPDKNKDGEITQADVLMAKGVELDEAGAAEGLVDYLYKLFGRPPSKEEVEAEEVRRASSSAKTQGTPMSGEEFQRIHPDIELRKGMREGHGEACGCQDEHPGMSHAHHMKIIALEEAEGSSEEEEDSYELKNVQVSGNRDS